ncbi:MAG: hypothetical protein IPN69_11205 [Acidobacteria bacterium]|nr:hypothetical protein [Acidobacteriota bacterium]
MKIASFNAPTVCVVGAVIVLPLPCMVMVLVTLEVVKTSEPVPPTT